MKPTHHLANHLRQFRRAADITQEQLAERVNVTRQTIFSIEKGNYTPSVALALQLAKVLGVQVEDLFELRSGANDEP